MSSSPSPIAARDAEHCPFRHERRSELGDRWQACGIATAFVQGVVDPENASLQISAETCRACCRHRSADLPQLNPIIASICYRALMERSQSRAQDSPATCVDIAQRLDYVRRRLQGNEDRGAEAGDHVGSRSISKSAWRSHLAKIVCSLRQRCRSTRSTRSLRLGLVGPDSPYGLGHANRDLAHWLQIQHWLVPSSSGTRPRRPHPSASQYSGLQLPECEYLPMDASSSELTLWCQGLDAILFVERPSFPALADTAHRLSIPLICFPNWEWIRPSLDWVGKVDLMLCPTQFTYRLLRQWQQFYRMTWDCHYLPWPIDTQRFQFRVRSRAEQFVSVVGNGGTNAKDLSGRHGLVQRKGLTMLLAAARLVPECSIRIYTSVPVHDVPRNVQLRTYVEDNAGLYNEGDVCVQCSYWEGCGMPLLESQASGMPLIAVDQAPMNEYQPLLTIPVDHRFVAQLEREQLISVPWFTAQDVAQALRQLHAQDITAASYNARRQIEQHHSWSAIRPKLLTHIQQCVDRHYRPLGVSRGFFREHRG